MVDGIENAPQQRPGGAPRQVGGRRDGKVSGWAAGAPEERWLFGRNIILVNAPSRAGGDAFVGYLKRR